MKQANLAETLITKPTQLVAAGVLAVTLSLAAQTAQAADWRVDPVVRVGYEFDDNARLVPDPGSSDEIQGYIIEGLATVSAATERTTFALIPRIRSRNYDEERFDSNDGFLKLDFNHEGLKSNFRIRGNYSQESVRTAERADADPNVNDPDEILGDDSGTAFTFGDRTGFWLLPQWNYIISEKSSIAAEVRYTDVDYEDVFPGRFTPYSDVRFQASLTRAFSTRTRGYIRASAGRFERDIEEAGVATEVDGLGVTVGIERGLTETTRFRAEVGGVETKGDGGESDSDVVWDINLVRDLETTTLLAQISRTVNSDGRGRVTLRDSFNLGATKQFSERVQGGLGIRLYTTDQLSSEIGTFEERDYAQIRARLGYALSRTFLVEADYRYTFMDRSTEPDSGKSNAIILWLTWQPTAATAATARR